MHKLLSALVFAVSLILRHFALDVISVAVFFGIVMCAIVVLLRCV